MGARLDGEEILRRVRWGNVARLAGVISGALVIAFGGRGCGGSEPQQIPLDPLPGEPLEEGRGEERGGHHAPAVSAPAAGQSPRAKRGPRPAAGHRRRGCGLKRRRLRRRVDRSARSERRASVHAAQPEHVAGRVRPLPLQVPAPLLPRLPPAPLPDPRAPEPAREFGFDR